MEDILLKIYINLCRIEAIKCVKHQTVPFCLDWFARIFSMAEGVIIVRGGPDFCLYPCHRRQNRIGNRKEELRRRYDVDKQFPVRITGKIALVISKWGEFSNLRLEEKGFSG